MVGIADYEEQGEASTSDVITRAFGGLMADSGDLTAYDVVINDEEQYSIWRVDRPVPAGWRAVGMRGSEEACIGYIEEHWTDMRPRSVRLAMAGADATAPELD